MFKNKKEIFSIRKFKNGRSDSVKIGALTFLLGAALLNASGSVYADVQTSSPNNIVENTDKVSSDKSATFIDNNDNTKKIKVDAVLDKSVTEPAKANSNTGEKDGTDTLNIKAKADVNYYLEEDKSKLKDSTVVEAGTGTVSTDYDKKGLAFDTDGKSYRTSTVDKTGISVTENLGKEDIIKANGKAYKLKRTEITNKDKLHYDKTTFNNLEATVTPENVNDENGVNYSNLTGKVYIVEEVSDGVYGKFVEANSLTNAESAVEAWKNGQANAKEFTKENVNLEEGDSILVLDKDTYATGTGTERVKKTDVFVTDHEPVPPVDLMRNIQGNEILDNPVYKSSISRIDSVKEIKDSFKDYTFGTEDDITENISNVSVLKYDTSNKYENKTYKLNNDNSEISSVGNGGAEFTILPHTEKLNVNNASITDIFKDINSLQYRIIDFFESADRYNSVTKNLILEKKTALNNYTNELVDFVKNNNIKLGILNNEIVFYHNDNSKLEELKNKIDNTKNILNGLSSTEISTHENDGYMGNKDVSGNLTYDSSNPNLLSGKITLEYHQSSYGSIGREEERRVVSDETNELTKWDLNGNVSITDKTIKLSKTSITNDDANNREIETTRNITYKAKDVISPIRAYKVISNNSATVNHYYDLKLEPEELKETIETKGKVVLKFVDNFGNEIKADENLVPETVIKTVKKYETKSDVTVISTREEVENNDTPYNAQDNIQKELTLNNKKYKFNSVLPVTEKYNNTTETTGKIKEGITTIIYLYDLIIPVDPTKPHEGQTNPPIPEDKVPNDPQNRSYKDLGLAKDVSRNISYIYEDGPKKGEQASEPVNQKAKFTRTGEINTRDAKINYTSDWTEAQKFEEVISPLKDKYKSDKNKVESLNVTHESENSEVLVKYSENPDIIEYDENKDKKGTVIVKLVDINGTVLKETIIKDNVIVEKATTKVYADRDSETTYTPTNEEYSIEREETITIDGLTFKLNKLIPATTELNNSIDETGKVKEGITNVIYEYKLVLPTDSPVEESEFGGGVTPIEPPVLDVPEFNGPFGNVPNESPIHEIPEFNGGVNPIEPPVVEIPEYNGGVVPLDPPVVEIPEFNGGVTPIEPPVIEVPEYTEPVKPIENKLVEPKQEKVLPNTNSTSILASFVSSVIGTLGLGYKSKRKK